VDNQECRWGHIHQRGCIEAKKLEGKFGAKWSPVEGLLVDKLSIGTDGRITGEATLKNALKEVRGVSTDLVCKVSDGAGQAPAGAMEVKLTHNKFTLDIVTDVVNGPTVSTFASALLPHGVTLGASCEVDTKLDESGAKATPELKDYNFSASYTKNDVVASLVTKTKLSEFTFALFNSYSPLTSMSAQATLTCPAGKGELKSMSVAALHDIDANTKLQAKVDNKGVISANYILNIQPGVKGVLSVQVDSLNIASDAHKMGISLILS